MHWNNHPLVGVLNPKGRNSIRFCSHYQGRGALQVTIVIGITGFKVGCKNPNPMLFQPFQCFRSSCAKNRHCEHCAQTGPDYIGVVPICLGVTQQHGIYSSGISSAQNGTQVARFFYCFEQQDQGVLFNLKLVQSRGFAAQYGDYIWHIGTIGDFFHHRSIYLNQLLGRRSLVLQNLLNIFFRGDVGIV